MAVPPQGIVYGDRALGRLQADGVYATPEFLQYLERLSATVKNGSTDATSVTAQVASNTAAITSINNRMTAADAILTNQISALRGYSTALQTQVQRLENKRPSQWSLASTAAVALTTLTPAAIITQTIPAGAWMLFAAAYFTGTGGLEWGRASVGITTAIIDVTLPGQYGDTYIAAAAPSPSSLGFDPSVTGLMLYYNNTVDAPVYVNAAAKFTGAISAYGTLLAQPL